MVGILFPSPAAVNPSYGSATSTKRGHLCDLLTLKGDEVSLFRAGRSVQLRVEGCGGVVFGRRSAHVLQSVTEWLDTSVVCRTARRRRLRKALHPLIPEISRVSL